MKGLVLVTDSLGSVGSRLAAALKAEGLTVRCATRRLEGAPLPEARLTYVSFDPEDHASMRAALAGCEAAYLLGPAGIDHAIDFARACEKTDVARIIYLGGARPSSDAVGQALRSSAVKTIELRAGLIVGHGEPSWQIVRDLAARLPAMILPRWTDSRVQPVAIDDVVVALVAALSLPLHGSQVHDLPGPATLSVRQILERVSKLRGKAPPTLRIPVVTPWLSSLWLRFVSKADARAVEELVRGLETDLLSHDRGLWPLVEHEELIPFDEAVLRAFEDEELASDPGLAERALERFADWMTRRAG